MKKILVTGAVGQIGSELVTALRKRHGDTRVVATDVRMPTDLALRDGGPFEFVDCTDPNHITRVMQIHDVGTIYHLAALLSATGESKPLMAWQLNMNGLVNMLEAARQYQCQIFFPSSIGAFGDSTPKHQTPQVTVMRPSTMYGITKLAGELLCDYYFRRFGVDTRGVRFPGLISYQTEPGGGTTDYAVDIFLSALKYGKYTCYLGPETSLDMMYMPDAVRGMIELMEADPAKLVHRNGYNITAMAFTPERLAAEIRKHVPGLRLDYKIDPIRQAIANSWPDSMDDSAARKEWGWNPKFGLAEMTEDMLRHLSHLSNGAAKTA
jgi:nucleoside-diphosphate-sugar epimerase